MYGIPKSLYSELVSEPELKPSSLKADAKL